MIPVDAVSTSDEIRHSDSGVVGCTPCVEFVMGDDADGLIVSKGMGLPSGGRAGS